jgi:hypothetical protein
MTLAESAYADADQEFIFTRRLIGDLAIADNLGTVGEFHKQLERPRGQGALQRR